MNGQYITSQQAWESLNEQLFKGSNTVGNISYGYDITGHISKAWVDPEFDFGSKLGYTKSKWTHLVNNYIDLNYLDIIKAEVSRAEKSNRASYSFAYHFKNTHANGKDCLVGLVVSKRYNHDVPVFTFFTRATELTKRFLFDLLLIQRVGEYIYGDDRTIELKLNIPMAYIQAESFTIYNNIKQLHKIAQMPPTKFQRSVLSLLDKFKTGDASKINYDSHRRISLKMQGVMEVKPMLAKHLTLIK
jgi:hypothetical protein